MTSVAFQALSHGLPKILEPYKEKTTKQNKTEKSKTKHQHQKQCSMETTAVEIVGEKIQDNSIQVLTAR